MTIVDRDGDRWAERPPDDGPPVEIHYHGTYPLVSAFTGPPRTSIELGVPRRPLHRMWGSPRVAPLRPPPAVIVPAPRAPSAEQQAFERFLETVTWDCERCGHRVDPTTMRVPEPEVVDGVPVFHLYCSATCVEG